MLSVAFCMAAGPALAANPQVEFDTTRRHDQARALPGRRAEDRRQLPRLRQGRSLRRHAIPPRHRGLHDPGRRLRHRVPAEADAAADCNRIRAKRQGGPIERAGHGRDGAHGRLRTPRRRSSSSTSATTSGSTSARRMRRATATRCSARSSAAWTSSTRSQRARPAQAGPFRPTCRPSASSSSPRASSAPAS